MSELLKWNNVESSAVFFNVTRDMQILGEKTMDPDLIQTSSKMFRSFYLTNDTATAIALENSPYIEAAIGETQKDVQEQMAFYKKFLDKEKKDLTRFISDFGDKYAWDREPQKPAAAFNQAIYFLRGLSNSLRTSEVDPLIGNTIRNALTKREIPKLVERKAFLENIEATESVVQTIEQILAFASLMQVDIPADNMNQIYNGKMIGANIERIATEQDALGVLIEIWRMLTPEQKRQQFGNVSMELHDFLSARSEEGLECLKSKDCGGFFLSLAKSWKIFPELRKYGVQKLRSELQAAVKNYAETEFSTQILNYLPLLPRTVTAEILAEIAKNEKLLRKISTNYSGFVKGHVRNWGKAEFKNLKGSMPAIEVPEIEVTLKNQKIYLKTAPNSVSMTGAATLGASMSRAAIEMEAKSESDPAYTRVLALQQLNKLLVIGGFKKASGQLFSSFAMSVNLAPKTTGFYIRDLNSSTELHAVPDSIYLKDSFTPDTKKTERTVSVLSQAELLIGITSMIGILKDWEETSFDALLGQVKVGDVVSDAPSDVTEMSLFPKEMLFALSVGNAAAILKNMTLPGSPLAMITDNYSLIWGDQIATSNERATMAAVFDIAKGARKETTDTVALSRYLFALASFFRESADLIKTQSPFLTERSDNSLSPTEQIVEARDQMKLLMLGISNFISSRLILDDGGVTATADLKTMASLQTLSQERTLEAQISAIEGLLESGNALGVDVYKWSAIEIYYYMNKKLWNPELSFYQVSESSKEIPSVPLIVRTLRILNDLKDELPPD
ncbi:MAG: hypothetical protein AB7O96_19660, partial [Pseudobdellovibrionaceae bacterium]